MTYNDLIVKEANFVGGLLETVKDQVNFKTKPFETIFGVIGTALSWKFGWIIGGLVTAAQLFGYGPGEIGKLIDDYFKKNGAKTVHDMDLSQSGVSGAATSVAGTLGKAVDSVKDKLKSAFASAINDVKEIKGHVTTNDKHAALYVAATTAYSPELVKTARIGHLGRFFRLWRRGNRMQVISGALMKLIWMFAKGLLALGIGGGVASMVGLRTKKRSPGSTDTNVTSPTQIDPGSGAMRNRPAGLKHYSNDGKDVKRTLITFLNATIANFSTGFMQAQRLANPSKPPVPLEKAPGWAAVKGIVQKYNWAPLSQVNQFTAFVAPSVQKIAQILLRSVNVGGVKIEKIDPKKPAPAKPTSRLPVGAKAPAGKEDRLRQLLQGEART